MAAVCVAIGAWFGYRQGHAVALEAIRFRQRWRRGEWLEISLFAIGLSLASFMLGVILSIPKWLEAPTGGVTEYRLVTIAACDIAGFVGGFGTQPQASSLKPPTLLPRTDSSAFAIRRPLPP
jgi:hypothetical protein